jgi:hypothetical protein
MGTYYPINYDKSIQKQKLVYKLNSRVVLSYIICYVAALALYVMILGLFGEFVEGKSIDPIYLTPLVLLVSIIYLPFAITNLLLLNSTIMIIGKGNEANKKDIVTILSKYYKLDNLDSSQDNITRDLRLSKPFRMGRIITCLFDDDLIYLNITRLENLNTLSPFSSIYNYYKCKRIAKKFQILQSGLVMS